jgi:hypothetical protein
MWALAMVPVWRKTKELKAEVISSRDSQNWTLDKIRNLRKQRRGISAKSTFIKMQVIKSGAFILLANCIYVCLYFNKFYWTRDYHDTLGSFSMVLQLPEYPRLLELSLAWPTDLPDFPLWLYGTPYTIHHTPYTIHCTHTSYNTQYTPHTPHSTLYTMLIHNMYQVLAWGLLRANSSKRSLINSTKRDLMVSIYCALYRSTE